MPTNTPTLLVGARLVRTTRAAELLGCDPVKAAKLAADGLAFMKRTATAYDDVDPKLYLVPVLPAPGSGRLGHVFDEARVRIFARSPLWKGWLAERSKKAA